MSTVCWSRCGGCDIVVHSTHASTHVGIYSRKSHDSIGANLHGNLAGQYVIINIVIQNTIQSSKKHGKSNAKVATLACT